MKAVSEDGLFLQQLSDLRRNRAIVKAAVSQNGKALQYASEALQGSHEIVMPAVLQNGQALSMPLWSSEETMRL